MSLYLIIIIIIIIIIILIIIIGYNTLITEVIRVVLRAWLW